MEIPKDVTVAAYTPKAGEDIELAASLPVLLGEGACDSLSLILPVEYVDRQKVRFQKVEDAA